MTVAAEAATLRVTRATLYAITAGLMAFSGTVFWAAGYAAGVHGGERLGALFVMGASVALLLVVLSILIQLRTGVPGAAEGAPARRPG